ncbi:unnamed protein product [Polarella glacialis]|uniref:PARP catalytic domain-containing protein n=1 Tax=Polarella glacialis TaxID=89957 RepID=A0A813L101_POLGL|nr:unnamed protein product [Polarella glacialis]
MRCGACGGAVRSTERDSSGPLLRLFRWARRSPAAPSFGGAGAFPGRGTPVCDACRAAKEVDARIVSRRSACRFGAACYQAKTRPEHTLRFAHPGDWDYRRGLVVFDAGFGPELKSLWQVFTYFDGRGCGYLSQADFRLAAEDLLSRKDQLPAPSHGHAASSGGYPATGKGLGFSATASLDAEWSAAGGFERGHVSFVRFATWAARLGTKLPVGLELSEASVGSSVAGWQSLGALLLSCRPGHWQRGASGLVQVTDPRTLAELQFLLDATHKESDNWTRDRGCALHGVNRCGVACAFKNRAPVPQGYVLRAAARNQNSRLWARYCLARAAVMEDCAARVGRGETAAPRLIATESSGPPFHRLDGAPALLGGAGAGAEAEAAAPPSPLRPSPSDAAASSSPSRSPGDSGPGDSEGLGGRGKRRPRGQGNEWRLFHGSSQAACLGICDSNFSLELVGSGATWAGEGRGPLYGPGVYLAERITKADEYAVGRPTSSEPGGLPIFSVLLCRVVGGCPKVVTTNEIDPAALRGEVLSGLHHSVLGDRVSELKKPFREVVIYDTDQIYPEFLLSYSRIPPRRG